MFCSFITLDNNSDGCFYSGKEQYNMVIVTCPHGILRKWSQHVVPYCYKTSVSNTMKKKLNHRLSTIPPISTKRTITSYLKLLNPRHIALDIKALARNINNNLTGFHQLVWYQPSHIDNCISKCSTSSTDSLPLHIYT